MSRIAPRAEWRWVFSGPGTMTAGAGGGGGGGGGGSRLGRMLCRMLGRTALMVEKTKSWSVGLARRASGSALSTAFWTSSWKTSTSSVAFEEVDGAGEARFLRGKAQGLAWRRFDKCLSGVGVVEDLKALARLPETRSYGGGRHRVHLRSTAPRYQRHRRDGEWRQVLAGTCVRRYCATRGVCWQAAMKSEQRTVKAFACAQATGRRGRCVPLLRWRGRPVHDKECRA